MRLLTINIHSHGSDFEPELYHQKMKALAAFMKEEEIDAAAIQECSEEEDRPVVSGPLPMHWVLAGPDSRVREDNCALVLAEELQSLQQEYWWTWTGAKLGYGKYNEGLAIFSRRPVTGADSFYISGVRDFSHWKTRGRWNGCRRRSAKGSFVRRMVLTVSLWEISTVPQRSAEREGTWSWTSGGGTVMRMPK